MIFDRNEPAGVVAVLGAGSMGTSVARRFAAGRVVLLGDVSEDNLALTADDIQRSGYAVETRVVDALDRDSVKAFAGAAATLGPVTHYLHTAGASPNQADPSFILRLDVLGSGYGIDAFGRVMAPGGAGLLISSQTGYMLPFPREVEDELLRTPTDGLLDVEWVRETATSSGLAYMIAKRINHLQAQKAAATSWAERRARVNTISPGVIVTPLAFDEFAAAGESYQRMIDSGAAKRVGTSDEIADAAAFLLGEHAGFITGTDLLIDGGTIAAIRTGAYQLHE